jgi:hypothetical protein
MRSLVARLTVGGRSGLLITSKHSQQKAKNLLLCCVCCNVHPSARKGTDSGGPGAGSQPLARRSLTAYRYPRFVIACSRAGSIQMASRHASII